MKVTVETDFNAECCCGDRIRLRGELSAAVAWLRVHGPHMGFKERS